MIKKIIWSILGLIALGIFVAWLTQSYWLSDWNQEQAAEVKLFQERGLALGKEADQQQCLDSALESFNQCSGFTCTVKHGQFLRVCLQHASPSEGFCDEVPAFNEERSEDDKSWARHACWSRDVRGEGCRILMRQQQQFCSQK